MMKLVGNLGLQHLAVEAGDVGDGLVLGANGLAGASVGAVAEAQLVHLGNHVLHTAGSLYTALRKQGELADLAGYEEHGRAVLTSCYASTTADAAGAVHCLVSILLGNEDGVGILSLTGTDGGIAASLNDLIEGIAVNHTVLDDGEGSRAPRLDGDDVTIIEAAHVELTGGGTTLRLAMRRTVDIQRAHTADTLAAVVIEHEGFLALVDEFLVQDVEHLEERGVIGDVVHFVRIEVTRIFRTILTPKFNRK